MFKPPNTFGPEPNETPVRTCSYLRPRRREPRRGRSTPIGDWLVKDGYANIRIDNCGGKMWGIVAWEKKPGGVDSENPDPAKKAARCSACRS